MHDKQEPLVLLTPEQAARYLSLSKAYLAKLRHVGGGPKYRKLAAKACRYSRADLDAWVESRVRSSTSEDSVARQATTSSNPRAA